MLNVEQVPVDYQDFKDEAKFVMEQKATLANLQSILSDFEGSNDYISNINSSFNTLSEAFKGVDYDVISYFSMSYNPHRYLKHQNYIIQNYLKFTLQM